MQPLPTGCSDSHAFRLACFVFAWSLLGAICSTHAFHGVIPAPLPPVCRWALRRAAQVASFISVQTSGGAPSFSAPSFASSVPPAPTSASSSYSYSGQQVVQQQQPTGALPVAGGSAGASLGAFVDERLRTCVHSSAFGECLHVCDDGTSNPVVAGMMAWWQRDPTPGRAVLLVPASCAVLCCAVRRGFTN